MEKTENLSRSLVETITKESYKAWQDGVFRDLVKFDALTQSEQDRIFNEFVVTGIGLVNLKLTPQLKDKVLNPRQVKFYNLAKLVAAEYPTMLKELGTPGNLAQLWETLIDMRLKEYKQDLKTLQSETTLWQEFEKTKDKKVRKIWARVMTLTVNFVKHVRRGDLKANDPLVKYIRTWITSLEVLTTKQISN